MADNCTQNIGKLPVQMSSPYYQDEDANVHGYLNTFQIDAEVLMIMSPLEIEFNPEEIILFGSKIQPKCLKSKLHKLSMMSFKSIIAFNEFLYGDLYRTNTSNGLCKIVRPLESFLKDINQNNLLVLPCSKLQDGSLEINYMLINQLIACKYGKEYEPYEPGSKFLAFCESPFTIYNVMKVYNQPDQDPAIFYFYDLIDKQAFQDINEALDEYKINDLQPGSIWDFVRNTKQQTIQNNIIKCRVELKQAMNPEPIAVLAQTMHINQYHEEKVGINYTNHYCPSCSNQNKCSILNSTDKYPKICLASSLKKYPLPVELIDLVGRLFPALVCQFKLYCYAHHTNQIIDCLANLKDLQVAISVPAFSQVCNYENMEVLGDSVIKYLISCQLFLDKTQMSENQMTHERVKLIRNSYFTGLFSYLKINTMSFKIHYKQIRNHMHITNNDQFDRPLTDGQMADIYEAIAGAVYLKNYEFYDVMKFLRLSANSFHENIPNHRLYIGNSKLIFEDPMIKVLKYPLGQMILNKPFNCQPQWDRPLNEFTQVIRLPFDNLNYALNMGLYERLEFLGDAAIEQLVIDNIYHLGTQLYYSQSQIQECVEGKKGLKDLLCPGMLHISKIILLDNGFMGVMALYYGFHEFAIQLSRDNKLTIITLLHELANQDFTDYKVIQTFANKVPKFLADMWESVAALILMEHGWEGLLNTYGKMYQPFIKFAADNLLDIYQYYQDWNQQKQQGKLG